MNQDVPTAAPEIWVSSPRNLGVIALAYAASMISQNLFFAVTGSPDYRATIDVVLTYHAENRRALAVTSGLETANMVLLLLFVTGLSGLVQRRGGDGADWSRLAIVAAATLSALFALTIATHIAVVLAAESLTEATPAFDLMWRLHAAVFALSLPALGVTFIGTALAVHANGLSRRWSCLFGVAGGSLPILAGFGNLAIADGSPIILVGVLGMFLWLVWIVSAGFTLIRM